MASVSELSSLYPPPPPYYKFFTAENIQKYNESRRDGKSDEEISEIHDIKFLVPPKHPEKDQYRSFGDLWWFEDKVVGLKESGIVQIYGDSKHDTPKGTGNEGTEVQGVDAHFENDDEDVFTKTRIDELKKMTKSLLLNFLELVGILSKNPQLANQKIDNIRTILINIHHLLNSYRLHQSRETLILTMQNKLTEAQEEVQRIKNTFTDVESKLNKLVNRLQDLQTSSSNPDSSQMNKNDKDAESMIYNVSTSLRNEASDALLQKLKNSS